MSRLFSILFMNAWSGLRRTISLLAVATVVLGVTTLVVASNMNVGIFSHQANSTKQTAANITRKAATSSSLTMLSTNVPAPKSHNSSNDQTQAGQNVATVAPKLSSSGGASQGSVQVASVTLGQILACVQSQSGQVLYTMQSAQLTLPKTTTNSGTISWAWEIQATNGSVTTTTMQQTDTTQSENVAAGSSTVIVPGDDSQLLLNFTGDGTATYQFRLHVSGAVTATSDWVSAPQAANTGC